MTLPAEWRQREARSASLETGTVRPAAPAVVAAIPSEAETSRPSQQTNTATQPVGQARMQQAAAVAVSQHAAATPVRRPIVVMYLQQVYDWFADVYHETFKRWSP